MAGKAGFYAKIADDHSAGQLHFEIDDAPLGHIELEAPELDDFIAQLGTIRSMLTEKVPGELEPNARLQVTEAPPYRIDNERSRGRDGIALSLRHPGYGWLTFRLERGEALVFVEHLRRQATTLT